MMPMRFWLAARKGGVAGLLTNPMTLRLLTKVVAGGAWPDSRARMFELAFEKLVREHNREHSIAQLNGHDVSRLMEAAGRLCAIQLLTGVAGYALLPGLEDDHDFLGLEQVPCDDRNLLRQVLDTRLFAVPPGDSGQGRAAPVHRQIAEFMAARYLAALIDDGLPAERILALIAGHDGGIVSEMRGLSAWLAAHSMGARAELIARDPLGTVLYGDARKFSKAEKCRLLDAVATQAANDPWTGGELPPDARLEDLVTPDMARTFGRRLSASARNHARQPFAFILLTILQQSPAIPELAEVLEGIVRDMECHPGLRREALEVYIGWTRHDEPSGSALGPLLADISSGSVSDPDDDLLGTLLNALYPAVLSVPEILPHLRMPRQVSLIGRFSTFWRRTVPRESSPSQLAEILDAITNDFDHLRPAFLDTPGAVSPMRGVPALLLGRLLEQTGAELTAHRLFGWLGSISHRDLRNTHLVTEGIRNRLGSDGALLEDLILEAVAQCSGSSDFCRCMNERERRFLQVPWPPNWCLQQAVTATDSDVAAYFVRRVASFVHGNPDSAELSRDCVETRLQGDGQLLNAFHERLAILVESEAWSDDLLSQEDSDRAVHRREWRESLLPHLPSLRENRGQPGLLHHLAQVYFGDFVDVGGATPEDRLRDLLDDDGTLTRAVLDALRQSVHRNDLPEETEIVRLAAEDRFHFLALPFMAGMEEVFRSAPRNGVGVAEEQMRLGLAIHFADPNYSAVQHDPGWLPSVLETRPDCVADVLVRCARPLMRAGKDFGPHFWNLARSPGHEAIARLASVALSQAFPTRCTNTRLGALGYLLQASLLHGDVSSFLAVVDKKLARRSMNTSQRVFWLAAGAIASSEAYLNKLEAYIVGSERRVRYLAEFLADRDFPVPLLARLEPLTLKFLVQVLGTVYRPWTRPSGRAYWVDSDMQASNRVEDLMNRLAGFPSRIASEALETLAAHDAMRPWHTQLDYARHRQNTLRRESYFRHGSVSEVFDVIANRHPANAADLAALTVSHLREISRKIRDGSTSDWLQYWNVNPRDCPLKPKPEDACRNALLSDLQARLSRLHVDAQPEGRYADAKRSDIRVSYDRFNVPVEIKKDGHRDLWSAIRTQLIAKYTRDPGTGGYGIYVVFWFGEGRRPMPETGTFPGDPAELEERLRATLTLEEARLVSICVIDVSRPGQQMPR